MPWTRDQWKNWCQEQTDAIANDEIQNTTMAKDAQDMHDNFGPETCSIKEMNEYMKSNPEVGYDDARNVIEEAGGTVLDPPDTSFLDDEGSLDNDF